MQTYTTDYRLYQRNYMTTNDRHIYDWYKTINPHHKGRDDPISKDWEVIYDTITDRWGVKNDR